MTAHTARAAGATGSGPCARRVLEYTETLERLVPTVRTSADWDPLTAFVTVDGFERIGTSLEVQSWPEYTEMLTAWASSVEAFETKIRRCNELPGLVYFEVEERHHRGGVVGVVNSLTVFEFDTDDRISHLDVYLQQRR